jgi:hypothetical protein
MMGTIWCTGRNNQKRRLKEIGLKVISVDGCLATLILHELNEFDIVLSLDKIKHFSVRHDHDI